VVLLVFIGPKKGRWVSGITIDYKFHHLGYFDDPASTAMAYNSACAKANGRFSKEKIKHNIEQISLYKHSRPTDNRGALPLPPSLLGLVRITQGMEI
jgi:hypothetical protein